MILRIISHMSLCNLLSNKMMTECQDSILHLSYNVNAIDTFRNEDGSRLFTPAHFDLIIVDESHRSILKSIGLFLSILMLFC